MSEKKLDLMDVVLYVLGLCNYWVLFLLIERKINEEDLWKVIKISKK